MGSWVDGTGHLRPFSLDIRTLLSDTQPMDGKEFIRRAREWAKAHDHAVELQKSRGKGGHQRLLVGGRITTVKTGEIGKGLLADMLRQLGIPKDEF